MSKNANLNTILALTYLISALLILFNKFAMPIIVHKICDKEKWPTKTQMNISYATKLTISLFANTALITFLVEIIIFGNYYGIGGGMIYSEFLVFILNAFVPPLAWFVDPWSIIKNRKRRSEIGKGNLSTLT